MKPTLNDYQKTLYCDLVKLTNNSESFYYADRQINEKWFRIFNYRMCSYTEFLAANALECRGHMFEISEEGKNAYPVRFVAHQFPKFFNYNENPFTTNLDLSQVVEIAHKMDGSLISTYMYDNDTLFLKTKGSLDSVQAIEAMNWLNLPENKIFKKELIKAEQLGFTVLLEYCSPTNRIVVSYDKPSLVILGVRSREDGHFAYFEDICSDHFPEMLKRWTKIEQISNPTEFLATVPNMKGIEGFVCRMKNGQFFKLKCEAYLALHHTKDSINNPRRLFESVLEETTDDLRTLFYDDPLSIKLIEQMEQFVEKIYNHMVDTVERFYETNKHLDRKEYAILGQQTLDRMFFGLAMNKYTGKQVDYKGYIKSKWKELGLKDIQIENE